MKYAAITTDRTVTNILGLRWGSEHRQGREDRGTKWGEFGTLALGNRRGTGTRRPGVRGHGGRSMTRQRDNNGPIRNHTLLSLISTRLPAFKRIKSKLTVVCVDAKK